jgi:CDP-diacylglycerol---serine O-phosphatidyltransferase
MIRHLPNALTLLNALFGCVALVFAFNDDLRGVLVCVAMSLLADLLDGAVARALKVDSALGKELDSLADAISFGVLPGVLMYQLLIEQGTWIAFLGFFITLASILRLAKFNLDTRQSDYFLGLATPANTIFFLGYIWLLSDNPDSEILHRLWLKITLIIVMSFLMLSEIPLIKINSFHLSSPSGQLILILLFTSIPILYFLQIGGLSLCVILYILLSLLLRKRVS